LRKALKFLQKALSRETFGKRLFECRYSAIRG
jgi:hypothetical protein